jgi:predicted RNase H-like HicB family nuclease/predicted RNA binding protein YcfA (HicA-like mRNA interferase family)
VSRGVVFHATTKSPVSIPGTIKIIQAEDIWVSLEGEGWVSVSTKGSHRQFNHPTKPGRVTVSGSLRRRHAERNFRVRKASGGLESVEAMKKTQYLVRINRDPGSDWGASVPDLPGCVATGKTIDSALRRIERAIELHVRGLRDDGLPVPRPSHRTITPRRRHCSSD